MASAGFRVIDLDHDTETLCCVALTSWIRNPWELENKLLLAKRPVRTARAPRFDVASKSRPVRGAGLAAGNVGIPRVRATYIDQAL